MPEEDSTVSLTLLRRRLAEQEKRRGILPPGDGGGTSGIMEARVGRLEEDMKEIKSDLKSLLRDVAEIKGRVASLPSTWQLITLVLGIFGSAFVIVRFGLHS